MERNTAPKKEPTLPLHPEITYVSLGRTISFMFSSAENAKGGALKAMEAIYLDDGIKTDIQDVDLSEGKGSVGWDYYGLHALKTDLRFQKQKDGRWSLSIDKVYSEGTSLREEVEQTVGEPSIVSYAYISLKLQTPQEGKLYIQTTGMDLTPETLASNAQSRAFWHLSIMLRDLSAGYDHRTHSNIVDRPEDMGHVLIDFAKTSSRETQKAVLEVINKRLAETHFDNWSTLAYKFPDGSLEAAMEKDDFDPVEAIQEICTALDLAVKPGLFWKSKLHFGSYSQFYLDSLLKTYEGIGTADKTALCLVLYNKCKARLAEKGASMPTHMYFGDSRNGKFGDHPLHVGSNIPIQSEFFVASSSTQVEGIFDIENNTFLLDQFPQEFSVDVRPTPLYHYSNDKAIQALINAAVSRLALQDPDYLNRRMQSAPTDHSHNWAIDKLATALIKSDDPNLNSMGVDLLEERTSGGASKSLLN